MGVSAAKYGMQIRTCENFDGVVGKLPAILEEVAGVSGRVTVWFGTGGANW